MLNRFACLGILAVFLAAALVGLGGPSRVLAGGSASVVESIVVGADISGVIGLVQEALMEHRGLSLDDQEIFYSAIGRTNRAIDQLHDTGATGDVFDAAEHLLLTQLDLLHEVETAALTEDLDDLNSIVVMLVDFSQARLAFDRQMALANGEPFAPLGTRHELGVVDIARDDTSTRAAVARVVAALAAGRPVGLDISEEVYRALGETSRGLDLVDETGETGDVFEAAVTLLEQRFAFLVDLEQAVISGDLNDLRAVAGNWVLLFQRQLTFERQLAARETHRQGRSFLGRRRSSLLGGSSRLGSIGNAGISTRTRSSHSALVYTVQVNDTLSAIAGRFGVTVAQIAQANSIENPRVIRVGQRLVIPANAAR